MTPPSTSTTLLPLVLTLNVRPAPFSMEPPSPTLEHSIPILPLSQPTQPVQQPLQSHMFYQVDGSLSMRHLHNLRIMLMPIVALIFLQLKTSSRLKEILSMMQQLAWWWH